MSYFPCRLEQTGLLQAGVRAEEDGGSAGAGGNGQTVCTLQTSGQNLLIETDKDFFVLPLNETGISHPSSCLIKPRVLWASQSCINSSTIIQKVPTSKATAQRYITQGESHES